LRSAVKGTGLTVGAALFWTLWLGKGPFRKTTEVEAETLPKFNPQFDAPGKLEESKQEDENESEIENPKDYT